MTDAAREALKLKLIDTAERAIEREGLKGVQARKLATAAGCAVGSIYNLFASIDELILHVNARTLEQIGQELDRLKLSGQSANGASTIRHDLQALAVAYQSYAFQHEHRWRAVFEHQMKNGCTVPEGYREQQRALFRVVENVLINCVGDATARERASRALFAAVHGILALSMDEKIAPYSQTETIAQTAFVIDHIAAGLEAATP